MLQNFFFYNGVLSRRIVFFWTVGVVWNSGDVAAGVSSLLCAICCRQLAI